MRKAAAFLTVMLLLCWAMARGQDAPSQSGPIPGGPPDYPGAGSGSPARGYTMEPGMTAPKIVQAVAAVYPADVPVVAGNARCVLLATIDQNGLPLFFHVTHSAGEAFDAAAIYAVRQSKFEAGTREEKAVPIRTFLQVTFTADQAPAVPEILTRAVHRPPDSVRPDVYPKIVFQSEPEFSEEARKKKIRGVVIISLIVTDQGLPDEVKVVRGVGYGLDEKAVEAVRQYRFKPAIKDGKPVAQPISVEVSFQIF